VLELILHPSLHLAHMKVPVETFSCPDTNPIHYIRCPSGARVIAYFHGGGTVFGSALDTNFLAYSSQIQACVFSISYPLAPESPYPSGVTAAYNGLVCALQRAQKLGADASNLTITGTSAGGLVASVVALKAHDLGRPRIQHQVLVIPMLSPVATTKSYVEFFNSHVLNSKMVRARTPHLS